MWDFLAKVTGDFPLNVTSASTREIICELPGSSHLGLSCLILKFSKGSFFSFCCKLFVGRRAPKAKTILLSNGIKFNVPVQKERKEKKIVCGHGLSCQSSLRSSWKVSRRTFLSQTWQQNQGNQSSGLWGG